MEEEAKILIVDDDPDVREALKTILETQPYQLSFASDGEECLRKAEEVSPDLIILDLLMPRKDGFEVIKELRDDPKFPRIPVLILTSVKKTASQRRYELETGLALDVDDYIEKPVQPNKLLHRAAKILKRVRE